MCTEFAKLNIWKELRCCCQMFLVYLDFLFEYCVNCTCNEEQQWPQRHNLGLPNGMCQHDLVSKILYILSSFQKASKLLLPPNYSLNWFWTKIWFSWLCTTSIHDHYHMLMWPCVAAIWPLRNVNFSSLSEPFYFVGYWLESSPSF